MKEIGGYYRVSGQTVYRWIQPRLSSGAGEGFRLTQMGCNKSDPRVAESKAKIWTGFPVNYYLDHHVYEHFLLELGVPAAQISAILKQQNMGLIFSEHHVHETVSCWKSGKAEKIETGRKILKLQLDLQPVRFLLPTPRLIKYEIARYGQSPFGSLSRCQIRKSHTRSEKS